MWNLGMSEGPQNVKEHSSCSNKVSLVAPSAAQQQGPSIQQQQHQQTKGNGSAQQDMLKQLIDEMSFWSATSTSETKRIPESGKDQPRCPSIDKGGSSSRNCENGEDADSRGKNSSKGAVWKTAVDPATGNRYYYDSVTRVTQWEKPAELRALERQQKEERRRSDQAFFKEMEKNVLKSLEKGELIPGILPVHLTKDSTTRNSLQSFLHVGPPREPMSPPLNTVDSSNDNLRSSSGSRIRTFSAMDEVLLAELLQRDTGNSVPSEARTMDDQAQRQTSMEFTSLSKSGRPPLPTGSSRRITSEEIEDQCPMELSPDTIPIDKKSHPFHRDDSSGSLMSLDMSSPGLTHEDALAGESLLDEPIQDESALIAEIAAVAPNSQIPKAQHTRRNTGGTIYLENTIYNPDIQATIKCVCGVYRAHVVQGMENDVPNATASPTETVLEDATPDAWNVKVFRDRRSGTSRAYTTPSLPSLSDILAFYQEFYQRSRMEHDTIIMSLIYVERLVKATNGVLAPCPENWRSILFSCMVLASKVWDDLSMWNVDFSNVSAPSAGLSSFTLSRINQLELALLKALNFDVRVPAGEYAKYYFLIRTMLLRSGLMAENAKPLQRKKEDDTSFSQLESLTTQYQQRTLAKPTAYTPSSSKGGISRPEPVRFRVKSLDGAMSFLNAGNKTGPVFRDTICLEQLVG